MIPRYSRPDMVRIWEPENRFRIWFEIEAHACEALAELGVIPKEAAKNIREKGDAAVFDVAKIDEIEREVKHDVIAFLTHLAEHVGPEARQEGRHDGFESLLVECVRGVRGQRHVHAEARARPGPTLLHEAGAGEERAP